MNETHTNAAENRTVPGPAGNLPARSFPRDNRERRTGQISGVRSSGQYCRPENRPRSMHHNQGTCMNMHAVACGMRH
jgi:hypothetical protein